MSIGEFFGFGGYSRPAEGYFSWQHLAFVTALNLLMVAAAVILGKRNRKRDMHEKNRVLAIAAVLMDGCELFKIILLSFRHDNPLYFVNVLPLFLCSIQLITIPLAAFSRGRTKEAALDFVMLFGVLGAVLGTYFAGNNYSVYPVMSFDNVVSGLTHCIAGFSALFIMLSGMGSMKKSNIPVVLGILGAFCVAAYVANIFTDCNYMFLSRGDGTPYDILFDLTGGSPVWYPLGVVVLFLLYIGGFYAVYFAVVKGRKAPAAAHF